MKKIEITIDENILNEAEKALYSIGMDVQIAVSIFLRRVAIEKGLPMSMTVPSKSEVANLPVKESSPLINDSRRNNSITLDMVDEVWKAFLKHNKGLGEIGKLSDEVSDNSGMSRGSAFIYLNILANWVKGEPNTRNLKMKDLKYLVDKIKSDLGAEEYQNTIKSLKLSVPYWREKIPGKFADNVEVLCMNA